MRARSRTSRRVVVLAAVASLGAGLLAGCADDGDKASDDPSASSGGGGGKGQTTITLGLFGTMGFKQAGLYTEYEKLHPDIKIAENVVERNENYYPALLNHLTTNAGLMDVQAIEVGNIAEIVATQADKFEDIGKAEGVVKSNWLDWKWSQGTTKDGKTIALGTDVGPMGICYRKDMFQAAGLPTDRDKVSQLWAGDWKKVVSVGEQYKSKAPSGTYFMDSPGGLFNAIVGSGPEKFYDKNGEVVYKKNPAVRAAFDIAGDAAKKGLVQPVTQFQPNWDQTIANSKFAAVSCPPWMLGTLKEKSKPDAAGKWDVAQAPKAANWGGSFLAVPKASKHAKEAQALVTWLTQPEQQAKLFAIQGSIPSTPAAYTSPQVLDGKNAMTGDAPIGKIFTEAAKNVSVQPIGPKDQIIQQGMTDNGVFLVTKGKSIQEAWDTATKTIDNNLDK
ncbi:extracellular solute-binding protein [Streptomyces acidiscabies]|uniref:Extracellular solute-binding protein n=1 Tax=Streptomyces acidiscabies TaxID=42234 RepID=A0AAP6EEB7_9ACTN|nr:extracellular solute-binding protein [Streptomyces acidiscabies]MBP5939427.1 extracellular solute-binding protein [Streptomyces sp. LBUM 1476]MBZ3910569.1 extracellular solute-binding protein [Streptomyces acidiscabies]MDX2959569.1 extracellular solute-binding protein [Streptomyces acidiscabies]MDX3019143.1 extracellular solute-binding protein [Streptomyces acidiscabies]MDX3790776.1 extracellular solute-binding protein [Streptomyces acidiscabies]